MKFFKSALATAALSVAVLAAAPANAITQGTIPGSSAANDFLALHGIASISGYFGANLFLVGGPQSIVEYFGAEAGNTNNFVYSGCNDMHVGGLDGLELPGTFINPGPATVGPEDRLGSCTVPLQASGLLPFSFTTSGPPAAGVANGANPDGSILGALTNFFISFDMPNMAGTVYGLDTNNADAHPTFGRSVFLFLDDNGGARDSTTTTTTW